MKIIAELCQNHNGSFDNVRRMVDEAAGAGATHVKIQNIYTKNLVFRPQFEEGLRRNGETVAIKRPWQDEYERLKKLELTMEQNSAFVEYVDKAGLVPLTTCFSRDDIDNIRDQGFKKVKVASYDCASYPMLRELSDRFEFLFVSTGATFDDEVAHAASVLKESGADYSLLHCVTIYPTPLDQMNLKRIEWLNQYSSEVGFSDHSLVERDGLVAAKAAILSGASVVERHFTVLGPEDSKDGPVSITPDQLRELVEFAKRPPEEQKELLDREHEGWRETLGRAQRGLSDAELLNRDYYRGRFAVPRRAGEHRDTTMIFNWEETPV